jgi:hypothetical protein
VLCTALLLAALAPQAQTGASRLILAAVTDPRGRPLLDVGADDFVVQEGAAVREILSVRVADYPIVVMLDPSAGADLPLLQKAAAHFIERLGNDRPVMVGTLGPAPRLLTRFDDDRKTVLERMNGLEARPGEGSGALESGAAVAANAIHATGALFSAIVIMSVDGDNPDLEARNPEPGTVAAIVDSGAVVHIIANRSSPDAAMPAAWRAIVEQTRGEYTVIYSAASYQAALDRLADRLSSEMLIEYLVPPGSKPLDAKVGIRVPGARVRGLGVAPK